VIYGCAPLPRFNLQTYNFNLRPTSWHLFTTDSDGLNAMSQRHLKLIRKRPGDRHHRHEQSQPLVKLPANTSGFTQRLGSRATAGIGCMVKGRKQDAKHHRNIWCDMNQHVTWVYHIHYWILRILDNNVGCTTITIQHIVSSIRAWYAGYRSWCKYLVTTVWWLPWQWSWIMTIWL